MSTEIPNKKKDLNKKEMEVKFITDLESEIYKLNQNIFHIPLNFTSNKLNELLNKLLSLNEPKNFSFFINNIKLTKNLNEFISENKIITENQIEIYYLLEINEPQKTNTIKENEWIKNIQILKEMKFSNKNSNYCVGLFNGEISFYNSNNKIYTLKNLENSVDEDCLGLLTCLKYYVDSNNNKILIRCLKNSNNKLEIYNINPELNSYNLLFKNNKISDENYLNVDINPINFNIIAMAGQQNKKGIIDIFDINNLSLNKTNSKKKRKIDFTELNPIFTFNEVHYSETNLVNFLNEEYLISCGDDFNINIFNINKKNLYLNFNTNYKNPTSLIRFNNNSFLIGFNDGLIKLYDIKQNEKQNNIFFKDPKAFTGYISDLSLCNDKENYSNTFVTSSYDSNVKIWDIRGGRLPLIKINSEEDEKIFSVKFNGLNNIIFGGDGSRVNTYTF